MKPCARLFNCARCQTQVILCRACDRGQVYCGHGCAPAARRESLRRAGARYRQTRSARHGNAERQRRFRACHQKVTHQGSHDAVVAVVLTASRPPPGNSPITRLDPFRDRYCCHRCSRPISQFLRRDFLRLTAQRHEPP